jgi:hypothetical protein
LFRRQYASNTNAVTVAATTTKIAASAYEPAQPVIAFLAGYHCDRASADRAESPTKGPPNQADRHATTCKASVRFRSFC